MFFKQEDESNDCEICPFVLDCENSKANECILEDIRVRDKVGKRLNKKKERKKLGMKKFHEFDE